MENFPIEVARDRLDELVVRATKGEDIRIVSPTIGTVRLEPVTTSAAKVAEQVPRRMPGRLKGRLAVPARLLEPMDEEELALWFEPKA